MEKLTVTKAVVLEIAAWAFRISGNAIEPPEEQVHPDGDGGPSWWCAASDAEFAGSHRHWDAVAYYAAAGMEFAARRGLAAEMLTDRVRAIIDHVGASPRPSVRRAAIEGGQFGTVFAEQARRHAPRPRRPDLDVNMEDIVAAYKAGMSTTELGKQYGVDGATIHRRLVKLGVARTVADAARLRLSRAVRPGSLPGLAGDLGLKAEAVAELLIKHGFMTDGTPEA